jgi:hypothetical protein
LQKVSEPLRDAPDFFSAMAMGSALGEGWVDDFGGVFRANEVYDPSTNTWSRAARMITPRHGFAVAQVGKTIYAVSGVNNAGGAGTLSVVPVNEIYEP